MFKLVWWRDKLPNKARTLAHDSKVGSKRLFFPTPPYLLTQHENIFLFFLCHFYRIFFGLRNLETPLKKDFWIT